APDPRWAGRRTLAHAQTDLTMTGKEFFGRLLNNRQEEDHSYDEEPSRDQSPGGEVDVAARGAERHDSHDASAPFGGSNYPSPDAAYDEFTAPAQASPAAEAYDRLGGDGIDAEFPEFRPAAGEQSHNVNGRAAPLEALENGSSNGTFGDSHPFDAPSSPASNGSHAGTPPVEGTPYDPAETSGRPAESRWSSPELTERMAHELEEAAEQLHAPGANDTSSAAPSPQQYEMPGLSAEPAQQGPAPPEYDSPAESYPTSPEQQSAVQGVPETPPPIAPNPTQHAAPEPVNHGPQPAPGSQVH